MQLWDVVETLQVLKHLWLLLSHYVHKTDSCPHNGNIRLVGPSGPNTVEGRVCANVTCYFYDKTLPLVFC